MSSANSLPRPHRHNSIETLSRTTLVCERAWRARRPNPTEDQRWLPQAVRSRQRYLTACSLAACSAQLHHQSGRDRSGRPRQPAEEAHSYEFRWPRSQPSIEVLWRAALFTGDKPSMEYGERHDAHPDHDHTGRAAGAASFTFLTSRARGLHQRRGSGTADTARLPLEGLSAFGGGLED